MKIAAAIAGNAGMHERGSPAAADIALTASNVINVVLAELIPQFERASGHR